jgi:hypothetical protein
MVSRNPGTHAEIHVTLREIPCQIFWTLIALGPLGPASSS